MALPAARRGAGYQIAGVKRPRARTDYDYDYVYVYDYVYEPER